MTLAELLKDNYKEGMSLEDVTKALESIEFPKADPAPAPGAGGEPNPMQSYETEKLKAAVSKANAEAAK